MYSDFDWLIKALFFFGVAGMLAIIACFIYLVLIVFGAV